MKAVMLFIQFIVLMATPAIGIISIFFFNRLSHDWNTDMFTTRHYLISIILSVTLVLTLTSDAKIIRFLFSKKSKLND